MRAASNTCGKEGRSAVAEGVGRVQLSVEGGIARVTFDRPHARNALTWAMYGQLAESCGRIDADRSIRVAVFRGAGGKAFVAGTDITQFRAFESGEDGVGYEEKIDGFVGALDRLRVPSVAVIEGYAVGGGLAIANACDIRIAASGARFGVPIARTVGNCLSAANLRRLCATLGLSWVKRMLLLAEMPAAETLAATGYVTVVPPEQLDAEVARVCGTILGHAPLTMAASRETLRRLGGAPLPDISDLIRACYGSADFRQAVATFGSGAATVAWRGE